MRKRKFLTTLLTLVCLLGGISIHTSEVSAACQVTYTNAAEIANYVKQGYNGGEKGPITITKGVYRLMFWEKDVYLITLSGTEDVKNQTTGLWTDMLSALNLNNRYCKNVVNVISANIPKGSNLIFAGHSLGGMIAQQCAANDTLKANYNIMNTVTFGSPLLAAGSREGDVRRLGDTADYIPYLSGSTFNNTAWQVAGLNREDGGYGSDSMKAHVESYGRSDVWGRYDVTGSKWGLAKLTLDLDTLTYYQSPVFSFFGIGT